MKDDSLIIGFLLVASVVALALMVRVVYLALVAIQEMANGL